MQLSFGQSGQSLYPTRTHASGVYSSSRYQNALEVQQEGVTLVALPRWGEVPESPSDQFHVVEAYEQRRLDVLSFRFYQNTEYWWLIALANGLLNPLYVPAGTILRIPPLTVIQTLGA